MIKEPINIQLSFLPAGKTAITIYPYIFWSKKRKGWEQISFIKHEMYHWNEQKDWKQKKIFGLTRWLLIYCVQWFWFNAIKSLPAQEHPMKALAYKAGQEN